MKRIMSFFRFAALIILPVAVMALISLSNLNSVSARAAPLAIASGTDLGQPVLSAAIEKITVISFSASYNAKGVYQTGCVLDRDVGTFVLTNNGTTDAFTTSDASMWQQSNIDADNLCRIDRDVGQVNNLTNGYNTATITITGNTTAMWQENFTMNAITLTVNRESILVTRTLVVLRV